MADNTLNEREVLERIRLEMDKHLRETRAPEDIHGFLTQHWARLMSGIFLTRGNQDPDWDAGWETVNALLWSLTPKQGRVETEKMLRMLPTILGRLQEGCSALGVPARERDTFFERLAMMHAAVARAGLKFQADQPTVTRMAGKADPEKPANLAKLVPDTSADDEGVPTVGNSGHFLDTLKVGDRVRFRLPREEKELILNWVSPVGGMFMFANEHGLEALTLTRARLLEKFRAGTVSPACSA
ncbi:MAG: DUF1631 family protein [Pseudomonadota bacterium]